MIYMSDQTPMEITKSTLLKLCSRLFHSRLKNDANLYAYLVLIDAIRLGNIRKSYLVKETLEARIWSKILSQPTSDSDVIYRIRLGDLNVDFMMSHDFIFWPTSPNWVYAKNIVFI